MTSIWDTRIRRATELVSSCPFAAEGLRFYAQIAVLQRSLYAAFEQAPAGFFSFDGPLQNQLNTSALTLKFPDFLTHVAQFAPAALSQAVGGMAQKDAASWSRLIEDFWRSPESSRDPAEEPVGTLTESYLAWLFLQPYAEYLAARRGSVFSDGNLTRCPSCGSKPIVGVLRPEGEGARKSLICMLCAHEWIFRRIYCPSCREERESHIAFYSAPEIPHVRVDVCDTCHTYLKSVDLTKTGLAVPVVDELAALPLDLWARENGYHKLQMNAVGM
jgi:formate dehydrogenase maturation protein FdhE